MKSWVIINKHVDAKAIAKRLGVEPLVVLLMANRGIKEEDMISFLKADLSLLRPSSEVLNLAKLSKALLEDVNSGKKIRIVGDYDVDGVMASYICYKGLSAIGADVDIVIPDRINDG